MKKLIVDNANALLRLAASLDWLAPLLMRLYFGYFWWETGWAKLHNLDGFTERFVSWGIPFPAFNAALSATTEFVGGILIFFGLLTRLTCIPMIINMLVAMIVVVLPKVDNFDGYFEIDEPLYALIFVWLLIAGPGRVSLDAWLAKTLGIGAAKTS